jgi:hypothetical protein
MIGLGRDSGGQGANDGTRSREPVQKGWGRGAVVNGGGEGFRAQGVEVAVSATMSS